MSNDQTPLLTPGKMKSAMNLNIALGVGGAFWFTVCSPQAIFNVFFKNHLGGTSSQLGTLVGIIQLTALFNLGAIFLFGALRRKKPAWMIAHAIHRIFGLVIAGIAFHVARGGDTGPAIRLIFWTMSVSWILTNLTSSGWLSWIADLFPEKIRATFFGRRSALINAANIVWFFGVTIMLDIFPDKRIFYVYAAVFGFAGVVGILDIILHALMPEPVSTRPTGVSKETFFEPIKNRNFVRFAVSIGIFLFSVNVFSPFVAPYITSPRFIGAPNTWLGIMFVISQLAWVGVAHFWGVSMDRFGRKPVVIMGALFTVSWIGYYALSPGNYTIVLPIISLTAGVLAPAFWEGSGQLMLTLAPPENRISYAAWYNTIVGLVSAGGAYLGGRLHDAFEDVAIPVTQNYAIGGIQIILTLSLVLIAMSVIVLSRIREGNEKPLGYVIGNIAKPSIFRTYLSMGVLSKTGSSERAARTLRGIEENSSHIAIDEVKDRLHDPDHEVREEAARALGRIGSPGAFNALVDHLLDPLSTIRPQAARALGKIGDPRAIPYLQQGLAAPNEDLQDACAAALGMIGGDDSVHMLLNLFAETRSERVKAAGAEAASRLGSIEAAWEILPLLHSSINPVLRRQLAISMGNILGKPGEFYRYMSGGTNQKEATRLKLFGDAERNVTNLERALTGTVEHRHGKGQRAIRRSLERNDIRDAARLTVEAGKLLLSLIIGETALTSPEKMLEHAFSQSPKLGVWTWLLIYMEHEIEKGQEAALRIDTFLSAYFLSQYSQKK